MNSELDKIKSTITISLGTKNKLRKLKGSDSYETYINYLINRKDTAPRNSDNSIEFQKTSRKKGIYAFETFKIVFSYNKFNRSQNFSFDISLEKIREEGKIISVQEFIEKVSTMYQNKSSLDMEYGTYFHLLQIAIQTELFSQFKHKGRFEDYYSWEQELERLDLPKTAFEEDVMEKLREYQQGQRLFEDGYN